MFRLVLPVLLVLGLSLAVAEARDGSKSASGDHYGHGVSAGSDKHFNKKRNEANLDAIYDKEVTAYKDWQATGNPESYRAAWEAAHVFGDAADFAAVDKTVTRSYDLNKNFECCDLSQDPNTVGTAADPGIGGIP